MYLDYMSSNRYTSKFHEQSQFKLSTTQKSDTNTTTQIQRCMYKTGWGKNYFLQFSRNYILYI